MRTSLVIAALGLMLAACAPALRAADRPLVGAIRWDAWTDWTRYSSTLAPRRWHYRLPFYAKVLGPDKIEMRADRPKVMEREIAYAKWAGIDYWAWCWYDPWRPEAKKYHMNRCLEIYRASPHRMDVHYCLIGGSYWATTRWDYTVKTLVGMFRDPNYQKVLGNRPLFYYFMADATVSHFHTAAKARAAMDLLRAKCVEAGLGPAYIVGLCFWPDKAAKAVDDVGFDAMGSYCNPGGTDGKELPYSDLMGLNHWFWEACKKMGKPFVPSINSGWDYRPMIGPRFPDRNPKGNWYTEATPAELAANLKSALDWVKANPTLCQADTVLIYAWDEFTEGGWICPTLREGDARLAAIRAVLRR